MGHSGPRIRSPDILVGLAVRTRPGGWQLTASSASAGLNGPLTAQPGQPLAAR